MKKIVLAIIFLLGLLAIAKLAGAQTIPLVTSTTCIKAGDGTALPTGKMVWQAVNDKGYPIPFSVGLTQYTTTPFSVTVTSGSVGSLSIPDPASSSPLNIKYHVVILDSTNKTVANYTNVQVFVNDGAGHFNWCQLNTSLYVLGPVANGVLQLGSHTITLFDTDGTLAGNSDLALPTEKAVKAYVDQGFWATQARLNGNSIGNQSGRRSLQVCSGVSTVALTIADAGTTGFENGWFTKVFNFAPGNCTITAPTSTMQCASGCSGSVLTLAPNTGATLYSLGSGANAYAVIK